MPAERGPLAFEVKLHPIGEDKSPGIINTGDSFHFSLMITVNGGTSFSHRGIEAEFSSEFRPKNLKAVKLNQVQARLAESGSFTSPATFSFPKCTILPHMQTYHGGSFSVVHVVRVTVKRMIGSIDHEDEIKSYAIAPPIKGLDPLCVRVAVAENVRIDLMINRRKFEIGDVLCGAAHFLLVSLKIKSFTVSLMAQELIEVGGKTKKHKHYWGTWEVCDGAPVKGEIVPFRVFFAPLDLSPTCARPESGYTVTHFLHFLIVTTSNEKYFKSLQIKLYKCTALPFTFTDE
jgi:vacuolar protein sorting-associated protein 26